VADGGTDQDDPRRWSERAGAWIVVVLAAVVVVVGTPVRAADPDAGARPIGALEDTFDRELDALLARDRVPGGAAAILHRGVVVWERAAGVADAATGTPMRRETTFQVASLSKPVAALGVLLLHQDGRIDLDRPVWEYLEGWRLPASEHDAGGVTVRRLLSHRAGVGIHGYPGLPPERPLPSLLQSLDGHSGGVGPVTLVSPPGSEVRYSSGGYTLLQLLVEETTGEPFGGFMERRVLRPLGMNHSSFEPWSGPAAASGHGWWGGRLPAYRFREQAASGLHSTAGDLARFLSVLSSPAAQAAVGISPAILETWLDPLEGGGFVLGFAIEPSATRTPSGETLPAVRIVSHNGANRGFRSVFAAAPDRGDGFVVLANSDRALAMTTDLLCAWGSWVSDLELASCWVERKRRGTLLAAAGLFGIGLLMDGSSFLRRQRRERREPRPRWAPVERHGWPRWARLAVSLALLSGWWLFWYTDLVATRREGIADFVPASALPRTFFWLTVVLTAWCLLGVARWAAAARTRRLGAKP